MESKGGRDLTGRKLGEFVLREQIGEGGYGAVHRGEQPLLKRDVVVKVLHERRQRDDIAQARFLREAQMASQLDHPYAAHIYAFGIEPDDGLCWIAMELVHGVTLDEWLRDRGPMTLEEFVPFFECVADVVQAAHERGIVHRDLKPANVMAIERRGRMIPKLLDFGIAKLSGEAAPELQEGSPHAPARENGQHADGNRGDADETRTDPAAKAARLTPHGAGIGSSAYMSPEQWDSARDVGPASDIYALGVLAYESLTGRVPFGAASEHEHYRLRESKQVPSVGGDLSSDLDRVFRRALARSPEARYLSALDLALELRSVLRASERELLRASARQWDDKSRAPGLLWGGDVLAEVDRWRRRAPAGALSALECSFVAASQRRARRSAWYRRLVAGLMVAVVVGAFQYRAAMQTRVAQSVTDATITQSELEQGRSALLHGELDAAQHLGKAYERGDHSPSTAFMLARALQSRIAEQARLTSTSGRMWSAMFSSDGRQIVTRDDAGARVHDADTGRLLFSLPHHDTVYQALYSADGTKLVTTGSDGAVRIWDAGSGALLRVLRPRRTAPRFIAVAISPDGTLVAATDTKGEVTHVWDFPTGAAIAELHNEGLEFPALAFSSDSRWLATTGGNDVHVFDARLGTDALVIRGPRIRCVAFDPTGSRLLTGTQNGDVAIWAIPSGERLRHLRETGDPVDAVAYAPNGKLVAAGSRDGSALVWQSGSGDLQSQLNARRTKIFSVEFDGASKRLLAANADGSLVVSDTLTGMAIATLEGPRGTARVAHFDPSSRRAVGVSSDGTARIWDATSPYLRWRSPPVADDCGIATTLEPDRRFIAIGCRGRSTQVWDTAHDELIAELPGVTQVDGNFTSAFPAVSNAGDLAAIARGNSVAIYQLHAGLRSRNIEHMAAVNAVAFAPTGGDLISGAVDGTLIVTRDSGAQLTLPRSPGGIDAVAIMPDGRLISTDSQRRLRVYDLRGAVLADLEMPMRIMSLRIERTRLVTVPMVPLTANAAPALLVDLESYRIVASLDRHIGRVFSARWVQGGQIITAGADGTARAWDGVTGKLFQTYEGGPRFLVDAALASDTLVMGGGADGQLRFWDRATGRPLWALPAHKSQLIGVHVEGMDIVTRGFSGDLARWVLPDPTQVIGQCGKDERCGIVRR